MVVTDLLAPDGSASLASATRWVEGALLGGVATGIAVIAVATIGLMMLGGRIDLRRGATVIIGCFIVFGASAIVAGLQSAVSGVSGPAESAPSYYVAPANPPSQPPPDIPAASDPYAGASVPRNR